MWRGVSAALAAALLLLACQGKGEREKYLRAVEEVWAERLGSLGISRQGLLLCLRADPEDSRALAVAVFYSSRGKEGFALVKKYFPSPEEVRLWLEEFIKKYVEVKRENAGGRKVSGASPQPPSF